MKQRSLVVMLIALAAFVGCSSANFDMALPDDSKLSAHEDAAREDAAANEEVDAPPNEDADAPPSDDGAAIDSDADAVPDDVAPEVASDAAPEAVSDAAPEVASDAGDKTVVVFPTPETGLCNGGGCYPLSMGIYMYGSAYLLDVFPTRKTDVRKLTIEFQVDDRVTGCTNREWNVSYNRVGLGKIGFTSTGTAAGKKTLTGTFTATAPISHIDTYDGKSPAPIIIEGGAICSGGSGSWIFLSGGKAVLE